MCLSFHIWTFHYSIILSMQTTTTSLATKSSNSHSSGRYRLSVVAQKRVQKKLQVVLEKNVKDLGSAGELRSVPLGYYRNYLQPQGLASMATESVLTAIRRRQEAEERARLEEKAKAQAMGTALSTIGKFIIKKKTGESKQIFGSVTTAEVVEAIRLQTGRELDKKSVTIPEIKELGTFDASVRLHPEVVGKFKIVVQKDTSQ